MPLVKLFGILIKTLSKPISTWIRGHLKDSPAFGKVMTAVGTKYRNLTNVMTGKEAKINQNEAISLGSEIVVEGLFFGIAGGLILYDHAASKKKSVKLEARLKKLENICFGNVLDNEDNTNTNNEKETLSDTVDNIDTFVSLVEDHMESFEY